MRVNQHHSLLVDGNEQYLRKLGLTGLLEEGEEGAVTMVERRRVGEARRRKRGREIEMKDERSGGVKGQVRWRGICAELLTQHHMPGTLTLTSKKAEPNVCHWLINLRNPSLASSGERLWWRVKLAVMAFLQSSGV